MRGRMGSHHADTRRLLRGGRAQKISHAECAEGAEPPV